MNAVSCLVVVGSTVLESQFGVSPKAMILEAFTAFDTNGDGELDATELAQILCRVNFGLDNNANNKKLEIMWTKDGKFDLLATWDTEHQWQL